MSELLDLEFYPNYSFLNNAYDLGIRDKRTGAIATSVIFKKLEPGSYHVPPIALTKNALQGLFDELWRQGFRPADGTGNSGHVAAIQYHLEDMRKLVFTKLLNQAGNEQEKL